VGLPSRISEIGENRCLLSAKKDSLKTTATLVGECCSNSQKPDGKKSPDPAAC
jgi:hypothetical protein